jgi:hypothetical protein
MLGPNNNSVTSHLSSLSRGYEGRVVILSIFCFIESIRGPSKIVEGDPPLGRVLLRLPLQISEVQWNNATAFAWQKIKWQPLGSYLSQHNLECSRGDYNTPQESGLV